jgi:hypothetical protein
MKKKVTAPVVWVVYKSRHAGPQGGNAVCEQAEWDEMEKGWPGLNTLIRAGVASESHGAQAGQAQGPLRAA